MVKALEERVADAIGADDADRRVEVKEEEARSAAEEVVDGLNGAGEVADLAPVLHEVVLGDLKAGRVGGEALRPVKEEGVGDTGAVLAPDDLGKGPGVFADDGDAFGEAGGEGAGVVRLLRNGRALHVDEDPCEQEADEDSEGGVAEARCAKGGPEESVPADEGDGLRGKQDLGDGDRHEVAIDEERGTEEAADGDLQGNDEEGGGEDPDGAAGGPGALEVGAPGGWMLAKAEQESEGEQEEDERDLHAEAGVRAEKAGDRGRCGPEVRFADAGGGGERGVLRDEEQPGEGPAEVKHGPKAAAGEAVKNDQRDEEVGAVENAEGMACGEQRVSKKKEQAERRGGTGDAAGPEHQSGGEHGSEDKEAIEAALRHVTDEDGIEEPGVNESKGGNGKGVEAAAGGPEHAKGGTEGGSGEEAEGGVRRTEERKPEPAGEVEGEAAAVGTLVPGPDHVAPGGVVQQHPAKHLVFPEDPVMAEDEADEQGKEETGRHAGGVGTGEAGGVCRRGG